MKLAIVIPVYNEGSVIRNVIESLPKKIKGIKDVTVVAVNDGSTDDSAEQIKKTSAILIDLSINMGAGAATTAGLEGAKILNSDIAVTMDGDGQHNPADIEKLIKPIQAKKADLVIGTRLVNPRGMPWYKQIGNKGLSLATFLLSGRWTTDSQSGFKAFSRKALEKLKMEMLGYEFCSEVVMDAATKKLKIKEVPVEVIYSEYSKRKGQSIFNGVNIIVKLFFKKITG